MRVAERIGGKRVPQGFIIIVKRGVGVPGDHIQLLCHGMIVQSAVERHKVRGYGDRRRFFPQERDLGFHVVRHVVCGEPLPFQIQSHNAVFAVLVGRLYLGEIVVGMAPEGRPPCVVQLGDIVVKFVRKVLPEPVHAQRAVALSAKFIGNMPHEKPRMIPNMGNEFVRDSPHFFPVDGRAHAVIVPHAVMGAHTVGIHTQRFGVFFVEPCGARTGGGGENGVDAVLIETIHDVFQPVEMKFSFPRLVDSPRKHAKGGAGHACLLHQADILLKDIGAVKPLLRVVISAVHNAFYLWKQGIFFHRKLLSACRAQPIALLHLYSNIK